MTDTGFALFGDVVESRRDATAATAWLRKLTAELEAAYPRGERLAPFAFTQGDELQGLLRISADPFGAVLRAALAPSRLPMRWVIAAGAVDPGRGPSTQRTGEAFLRARALTEAGRGRREPLLVRVGSDAADALLDDLTPLLGDLLADLTERQRVIARHMLVDGLRQSEVAERLAVRRATISVMVERARIRRIEGLLSALRTIVRDALGTGAE